MAAPQPTTLGTARKVRRIQSVRVIVAVLVLLAIGWIVEQQVATQMRERLGNELSTVLHADVKALEIWLENHTRVVDALADSYVMREHLDDILAPPDPEARAAAVAGLRANFVGVTTELGYTGYYVLDPSGRVIAASNDLSVGNRDVYRGATSTFLVALEEGRATVSRPVRGALVPDGETEGAPIMYAVAPFCRVDGKLARCEHEGGALVRGTVVGALAVGIDPAGEFTQILRVARSGKSGETYAFGRDGLMLSGTRFPEDLVSVGLLPPESGESATILHLQVRDPGGNLLDGFAFPDSVNAQPLTRMARSATSSESGVDLDGYRDYRGVPVVGAWQWLDAYDFGVATEVDEEEAYKPLDTLRWAFGLLFALVCLTVIGALMFARWLDAARRRASRAERAAQQLGRYTLVEKIGEGGMGEVWMARHAMLRRPTAVKLLPPEKSSRETVGRFEREVQMTARLSHPNTISIFDYGHTPDDVFYYAMEFLEGLPLDEVIRITGPLSSARVIHVLRQTAGSLYEAHCDGLIHRDVKPANLMLCDHGGLSDFTKVLDFGLVKDFASEDESGLSQSGIITGTPMYIAPEVVTGDRDVGPGADIYALGAVAYHLLCGRPVFDATNAVDHLLAHAKEDPALPSTKTDLPIDPDLEALVMSCLAKDPADRPATMLALAEQLDDLASAHAWGQREARAWWQTHGPSIETALDLAREDMSTRSAIKLDVAISDRRER